MKITEVISQEVVQGNFGPQQRARFRIEDNDNQLSGYFKFPIKVGDELNGTITVVEKDGKTYHNFKAAPKTASAAVANMPDLAIMKRDIAAMNANIVEIGKMVRKLYEQLPSDPFEGIEAKVVHKGTNVDYIDQVQVKGNVATVDALAAEFDDIDPADIPF